jgi:23S rRNA pseudouridine1911/1915/1917 synthase
MDNWDALVKKRSYIALAEGDLSKSGNGGKPEGLIDAPLGEDAAGRVIVMPGGKPARTRWKLLKLLKYYSLLELELETGRRNQIRVHLKHIGHPVAGDKKYGSRTNPLGRLALHADHISFLHPLTGRLMEFTSAAPKNFSGAR